MEDKCPNCQENLITSTIKKELGHGSIFIPIAQSCPKCNWKKDLTGASDVVVKPSIMEGSKIERKDPHPVDPEPIKPIVPKYEPVKSQQGTASNPIDMNKLLTIVMAIIVMGGIAWAFYPEGQEQPDDASKPVQTPAITETPVVTDTIVPEFTPTGNKVYVKLDRHRIFRGAYLDIKPGDEVVWINDGIDPFTLVSDNIPDFKDRRLDNGKQTSYIFKRPGSYDFYVKDNNNANGTIVVAP
jgi:plastocyanin